MKKVFMTLFLLMFLLVPLNATAVSVSGISVIGEDVKKIGEELDLTINISFSGIDKNSYDSLGLITVVFDLFIDDKVLAPISVVADAWDSTIVKKSDGVYTVVSQLSIYAPAEYKCVDGILNCSDYSAIVKFVVKNTEEIISKIKMDEVSVGLMHVYDPSKPYSDKVITVEATALKNIYFKIQSPEIIITPGPAIEEIPKIDVESKPVVRKSNNRYLSSLEVEGHKINFDKERNSYNIVIDKGVNKLNITAKTEDLKATYKIVGADDLAANNNMAIIEVTAENGLTNKYIINVREKNEIVYADKKDDNKFTINKKVLIIGGIILGILIFLILIIKFILTVKDRKLEKALDKL